MLRDYLKELKPYQPGKRVSEVKRELGLAEIVKLASNESAWPPTPKALKAMQLAVAGVNRYPDSFCYQLKQKLAALLKVKPEKLAFGNGSNELIRILAQILVEPGQQIVMATPSFIYYPIAAQIVQAKAVQVPLDKNYRHDLETMAKAVTKKTKLVFVCNPNNPTGTIVSAKELKAFLEQLPPNVVVAVDEAYHEYVDDPNYQTALNFIPEHPNLVVLRTFSKIFGLAGTRIGYLVANEEIVTAVNKLREPFNVNLVAQVGAYFSLDELPEIAKRRQLTLNYKKYLYKKLEQLGVNFVPSQTNFIYLKTARNSSELFEEWQRQGVIVRPVALDGSFIRVTVGTAAENRKFLELVKRHIDEVRTK